MKRIISILFFVLVCWSFVFAQFQMPEIDRVKEIKLLESDRFDVQRILYDFESDSWNDSDHSQRLSTENFSIEISYSTGNCNGDNEEIWGVPEWKVTQIEIRPDEEPIPVKSLGFDISPLEKEREYVDIPDSYIYYRKDKSAAFEVYKNKVKRIYLLPSKHSNAHMCNNETAETFGAPSWFGDSKLKDRVGMTEGGPANVIDLVLGATEFGFTEGDKELTVTTTSVDPENDVLTYLYNVSAGQIVGEGSKVIWNLKGVGPGTYTITAGVDDGCGICGKTMTKSVTIK
jgi:hypothetical protein